MNYRNPKHLNIFISSPNDVSEERKISLEVIEKLNKNPMISDRFVLKGYAYEDNVPPVQGLSAQSTVDRYMLPSAEADIVICILWSRIGTPYFDEKTQTNYQSGTEYEYLSAYATHVANPDGPPYILLYQGRKSFPENLDPEQLSKVRGFFKRFETGELQGFYKTYSDNNEFSQLLEKNLLALLSKIVVHIVPPPPSISPFRAVPRDYTLQNAFLGREVELKAFDEWVHSKNRILVVHAMGGMGKSALTWEWAVNHAKLSFKPKGIFWFNFYEKGATLKSFIVHALAYVTGQTYDEVAGLAYDKVASQLIQVLREDRYLLVLDGIERVLVAYHRLDSAHLLEEEINESPLMRQCVDPNDDDFLQQIINCGTSKILLSSRLIPSAFENFNDYLPYVQIYSIKGLQPDDAVRFAIQAGISQSTESKLKGFLAQFGYHPMLIMAIAGLVKKFPFARGNFDEWHDGVGQYLNLSKFDVDYGKVTEILKQSTHDLTRDRQLLLAILSVFGEAVDARALFDELNPYLPLRPDNIDLPPIPPLYQNPFGSRQWAELDRLLRNTSKTNNAEEYAELEAQIERRKRLDEIEAETLSRNATRIQRERKQIVDKRLKALEAYRREPRYLAGIAALEKDLTDLEDRSLIEVTSDTGKSVYDLHPLVRAHVTDKNGGFDQSVVDEARQRVLGELTKRPSKSHNEDDLARLKIEYKQYIQRKEFDKAAILYRYSLSDLMFNTDRFSDIVELLIPLFEDGLENRPSLMKDDIQAAVVNDLLACYVRLGKHNEANALLPVYIEIRLGLDTPKEFIIYLLGWLTETAKEQSLLKRMDKINRIAVEAAEKFNNPVVKHHVYWHLVEQFAIMGRWEEVERIFVDIEKLKEENEELVTDQLGINPCLQFVKLQCALWRNENPKPYFEALDDKGVGLGFSRRIEFGYWKGVFAFQQHEYDKALVAIDECIRQSRIVGTPSAPLLGLRSEILLAQGEDASAEQSAKAAEEAIHNCSSFMKANTFNSLARMFYVKHDWATAEAYARLAFDSAIGQGNPYIYWYGINEAENIFRKINVSIPAIPAADAHGKSIDYEHEIIDYVSKIAPDSKPSSTVNLKVKDFFWFQIGVIACFDVKSDEEWTRLVQLGRELYALSDDPGPFMPSGSDQLVDPYSDCSYTEECVAHKLPEELDLRFLRQAPWHDVIAIVFISAVTEENKPIHFFMSARSERLIDLYQDGHSGKVFDVSKYGRIVNGPFDTITPYDTDTLSEMFGNWLACNYFLPFKLISRAAGE